MTSSDYSIWFNEHHARYQMEAGASPVGPRLDPTGPSGPVPWKLKWAVIFKDGYYAQVTETYTSTRREPSGERLSFLYHYGKLPPNTDPNGFPLYKRSGAHTEIRVDLHPPLGPHLHYGDDDHITQARVSGFCITDCDIFRFMNAVNEHRLTARPFHEIFGFEVKP
jgi:hypothetical protein